MSDGTISIKIAHDYDMKSVQQAVERDKQNEEFIQNDEFFPNIVISEFRNASRLDGTVTIDRLKEALFEAVASVNDELNNFKQSATHTTLAEIPSGRVGNQSVLVYRYKRAVYCLALANLYERYASYDTTNDGEKKMELLQESINQIRRDARFAINDILGRRRITTELI
ncbi:head completion/stabilization protein [Pasteurella multocida]|uniref:head completion/stabilization protein n=1 Tax=Pasteurella multocida TaxID=747 RepID=UPI00035364E6|nr:head completion/stabilization protein [Pasteurella multocida]AUK49414.1 phage head protein [Pasteurella multocida]AUK54023.1 phage head protein [Pasteurella multocida]EPE67995.1 capsid completion protein [Pasteurella multocida P1933]ESQ72126.1 head protein [Pasteurella multocida subsp. multocida P1062]MCL7838796.1 head completion/stabilization protein [Pasteurella multocida]